MKSDTILPSNCAGTGDIGATSFGRHGLATDQIGDGRFSHSVFANVDQCVDSDATIVVEECSLIKFKSLLQR